MHTEVSSYPILTFTVAVFLHVPIMGFHSMRGWHICSVMKVKINSWIWFNRSPTNLIYCYSQQNNPFWYKNSWQTFSV